MRARMVVGLVLAVAFRASAQESTDGGTETGTPSSAELARARFEEGVRLFRAGDFAGAVEQFRASFDARPNPAIRYNIGVCQYNLGRLVDARRELALYLGQMDPALITEERRWEVEMTLAELDSRLALLDLRVHDAGASVTVDGVDVGATPLAAPVPVLPGEHDLRVILDGDDLFAEHMTVVAGERRTVVVAAAPERPVQPAATPGPAQGGRPDTGRLVCSSHPSGARILLDGGDIGATPSAIEDVEPGDHAVQIVLGDGRLFEDSVFVATGSTVRVAVEFGGNVDRGWFWGTASSAVVLGVAALGTGLYGKELYDEFNDPATSRARQEEIQPAERDSMLATDVLAILGSAAAVVAIVLAFFTDFEGDGPATADVGFEMPGMSPVGPATPAVTNDGGRQP